MNETLHIVRKDDLIERVYLRFQVAQAVIRRGGNRDWTLSAAAFQAKDNVLLQHIVVLECLAARSEEMKVPDCSPLTDELSERAIVRPVAETAWNDRNDLSPVRGLHDGKSNKRRVQIHRFDTESAKFMAMRRITVDFFVWWIQNRMGVIGGPMKEKLI